MTINGVTTDYYTSGTSLTFSGVPGQVATVVVQAVNPNDNSILGPVSASSTVTFLDPNGDNDGDGFSNVSENVAGTDPFDTNSYLHVTNTARSGADVQVTWTSVPGRNYVVQSSPDLTIAFTDLSGVISAASSPNTTTSYTDIGGASGTKKFYRVRVATTP